MTSYSIDYNRHTGRFDVRIAGVVIASAGAYSLADADARVLVPTIEAARAELAQLLADATRPAPAKAEKKARKSRKSTTRKIRQLDCQCPACISAADMPDGAYRCALTGAWLAWYAGQLASWTPSELAAQVTVNELRLLELVQLEPSRAA